MMTSDLSILDAVTLWERQQEYNARIGQLQSRTYDEWMQTYLLGLNSETCHILEALQWKLHRGDQPDPHREDLAATLADMTKWLMSMWQASGFSLQDVLEAVDRKSTTLETRLELEHSPQPTGQRIIVSDIDGTLADFVGTFCEYVVAAHIGGKTFLQVPPQPYRINSVTLHLDINFGWDATEYRRLKQKFEAGGGYARLEPFKRVLSWLYSQLNDGVQLHVWTARPYARNSRVWQDSWNWLAANDLRPSKLNIGSEDRVKACQKLQEAGNTVVLLEDNPTLVERAKHAGIPVILVQQPYNRSQQRDSWRIDPENGSRNFAERELWNN